MSGHSKWATTKHQKAVTDSKRSAIFTKIANLIAIAAKKGGDPKMNFTLQMAISKAKGVNMPKDNIEKAIKRGAGLDGGANFEELIYEGIGPANTQFIVKCLTDNKNRSASTVRHAFSKHGGSFGSVAWNFEQKGVIIIETYKDKIKNIDELELELIEQEIDDLMKDENTLTIYTKIKELQRINKFLESKNIPVSSADIEYIPLEKVELSPDDEKKVESFVNILEDNEDVSDYYSNIS